MRIRQVVISGFNFAKRMRVVDSSWMVHRRSSPSVSRYTISAWLTEKKVDKEHCLCAQQTTSSNHKGFWTTILSVSGLTLMTTEPFVAPSIYKSADSKIVKIYVRRIITFEAPPHPQKKRRRRKETSADSPDTIKDQYCSKTAVCYVFIVTVKKVWS